MRKNCSSNIMNSNKLRKIISECCNDIVFFYQGKPSGITSEVHNFVPTFQVWHGDEIKEYDNIDDVMTDTFYSGKSLTDIAKEVEFDIL